MFARFSTAVLVIAAFCVQLRSTSEVVINSWLDFDCQETNCTTGHLVYTKSVRTDANSSNHFIWSTIGGYPAFFAIHTESEENVTIDWDKLFKNEKRSIFFGSESVQNTVGVLFSKMYFWEGDPDNFDNINETLVHAVDLAAVPWDSVKENWTHSDRDCIAQFSLKKNHTVNNGSITIKLKVVNSDQRYDNLPRLWLNWKSMHIQTIVEKMKFHIKNVRLGFELLLFSSGNQHHAKFYQSIDDEFSPGIFQTYNLLFENNKKSDKKSFLQWKPVIYSTPEMIISKILQINAHKLHEQTDIPRSSKPMYGFLSGLKKDSFEMLRFNVTFGSKGEEYYSDSNYTSWSFAVGFGEPRQDDMSVSIKLIIVICFGLPAIALLLLPVVLIVQKCKQRRSNLLLEEHFQ